MKSSIALLVGSILWAIASMGNLGAPLARAQTPENVSPVWAWNRFVNITTSLKGYWMFVTVVPRQPGKPLEAAFVLQFDNPGKPMDFHGQAQITYKDSVLWVKPIGGDGWLFDVGYKGKLPKQLRTVPGVVGIARYWNHLPDSHAKFVSERLAVDPDQPVR